MESIWRTFNEASDERTKGWWLVDSPDGVVLLLSIYWLAVWIGPKVMKE